MRKNNKRKKLNNLGTTMLEVVIGFAVLMVLDAGFLKLIAVGNTMYYRSVDMMKEAEHFKELLYQDPAQLEAKDLGCTVHLESVKESGDPTGITLRMSTKVTQYREKESTSEDAIEVYRFQEK
ncbi:MAG: hypothetical protein Q4D51_03620 [Eubacteriales bacterium]|nr:hypothetical protein [Eubacteriales bacterium]